MRQLYEFHKTKKHRDANKAYLTAHAAKACEASLERRWSKVQKALGAGERRSKEDREQECGRSKKSDVQKEGGDANGEEAQERR